MKSSTQKGCKGLGFASEKPTEFIGLDWTSTKNEVKLSLQYLTTL